ncbi:FtsX-like permease family protein [Corynebacterium sp. S7]
MNTAVLVSTLSRGSRQARTGSAVVSIVAVIAMTVTSFAAFLLAGGTWMFYQRSQEPFGLLVELSSVSDSFNFLDNWLILAVLAGALLIPGVISLASQAAVLGVSGRENRLAALRLLGLSARQITRMTVYESGIQAMIGIVFGFVLSLACLPFAPAFTFQGEYIRPREMLLPWWAYLLVALILIILVVVSSAWSMQRVRVSPLGVAKKDVPATLKAGRFVAGLLIMAGAMLVMVQINLFSSTQAALAVLVPLLLAIAMLNLIMPFLLQTLSRIASLLPGSSHYVATQRVVANGRLAWRRSGVMAFFGIIAGFLVTSPLLNDGFSLELSTDRQASILWQDISTGSIIALVFGFTLTAMSVFLGQTSSVYEDAELTRALHHVGVNKHFHVRVAVLEVLAPMIIISLAGFALGGLLGLAILGMVAEVNLAGRIIAAFGMLACGWIAAAAAVFATQPLRSQLLAQVSRKND